jgi:ribonuclease HI
MAHITIKDTADAKSTALRVDTDCPNAYFTDGSRSSNGQLGAAWVRGVEHGKEAMGKRAEVFDAELKAILLALQDAARRNAVEQLKEVHIFSDSQAALQRIEKSGYGPGQALVKAIHDTEQELTSVSLHYNWVPGHCGVPGNEAADFQAKEATAIQLDREGADRKRTTLSHLNRLIKERSNEQREGFIRRRKGEQYWFRGERRMNPILRQERKADAAVFNQFACGHAITGEYLRRIGKLDDETCWHCGKEEVQDRAHLFLTCSQFREERKELEKDIRQALKQQALEKKKKQWRTRIPLHEYFGQECVTRPVMDFLRSTEIGRRGRPPEE